MNRMRRVLMVTPHFPPDTSAATHRVRLLARHLPRCGWEPTVVTVDSRDYEGRLDPELEKLVPHELRVIRCRAWPYRWTRRLGVGDLGLRALRGLSQTCRRLLEKERFDVLFITIYPSYPALLGPKLKREFEVPFVLDYQDPWVGASGKIIGPGGGKPDIKSRMTRWVATKLEPPTARAADAITAVSAGTYEAVVARNPALHGKLWAAIPLGGEVSDFDYLRAHPRPNRFFDPRDGLSHICYIGTVLPLGFETLRALLNAVAAIRMQHPSAYSMLRLHFIGTSNQTFVNAKDCVLPLARELGVADCVTETAPRVDYLDALNVQTQATAILMMGSSERHYTASKLYPVLLARRPVLAVYHEASSVVGILRRAGCSPTVNLVTYDDIERAESRVTQLTQELLAIIKHPVWDEHKLDMRVVQEFSAQSLARSLAAVFEAVASPQMPR